MKLLHGFLVLFIFITTQVFALDRWGGDLDLIIDFPQSPQDIQSLPNTIHSALLDHRASGHSVYPDALSYKISTIISSEFRENDYTAIVKSSLQSATSIQYIIFDISALDAKKLTENKQHIFQLEKSFLAQRNTLKFGFIINYGNNDKTNEGIIRLLTQNPYPVSYLDINGHGIDFITKISKQKNISEFNKKVDFVDLSSISLSNTNINIFTNYIESLSNLRGIHLSSLVLQNSTSIIPPKSKILMLNQIGNALKKSNQISYFNLSSNDLDESSAIAIANILKNFPNLVYINLSNNNFSGIEANILLQELIKQKNLTFIDISSNNFNESHANNLVNIINNNLSIEFLDASYNSLGINGYHKIRLAINQLAPTLQVFKIRKNYIIYKHFADDSKISYDFKKLYYIDTGDNYFFSKHSLDYAKNMRYPKSLEYLYLDAENMGSAEFTHIANSLNNSSQLKYLNISHNNLSGDGVKAIVKAINEAKHLNSIDFSGNNFSDADSLKIVKALTLLSNIHYLNMNNNRIGDDSAAELSRYFSQNRGLKSLDLSNTELSNEAILSLASAIKAQKDLAFLNLSNNNIDNSGLKNLVQNLKDNPRFTTLIINGNVADCDSLLTFDKTLKFKCE